MNTVSAYVFRQVLGPLLAILGALAAIAILTQGLNQLDIIIGNRNAGFAFVLVTLLALPQLVALIMPMAVFISVIYALNRMLSESEVAVMFGAGISRGAIARPIIQLATLAALVHLTINVAVQPAALAARRDIYYALQSDIASSLIREGTFTYPTDKLTLYARGRGGGGELRDLLINDARQRTPVTYTARAGAIVTIDGRPSIVLRDGQVQRPNREGGVDVLDFDRYVLQMGQTLNEPPYFFLKPSDRSLHGLFFPDMTSHYDQRNVAELLAEGHARLSSPLSDIALAMVALAGILVGEFRRGGYGRRIVIASVVALLVRLAGIGIQSAAVDDPRLNVLQYLLPLVVIFFAGSWLPGRAPRRKRRELGPSVLAEAR